MLTFHIVMYHFSPEQSVDKTWVSFASSPTWIVSKHPRVSCHELMATRLRILRHVAMMAVVDFCAYSTICAPKKSMRARHQHHESDETLADLDKRTLMAPTLGH